MRISYSSFRRYIDCPRKYKLMLDRVDPPVQSSKYFALYGLLIEKFFEHLTNHHYKNNPNLRPDQVRMLMKNQWHYILKDNFVIWDEPWCKETSEEIFESAVQDAIKAMESMSFFKNGQAEVVYETVLKKSGDILTGRIDFITKDDEGKVLVLDGKGTTKMETNVDVDQLYFYSLLYLIKHKRLPDKLGFLYYRYQTITYVDINMDILIAFKNKLALVKKAIKADTTWEPKVKITKQCKWCEYQLTCDAFIAKKAENSSKRKKKSSIVSDGSCGFQDLEL